MTNNDTAARLEYLRGEIRAERMSYGDVAELQGLAEYIDPGDVELLEWAGVPEFPEDGCADCAAGHPVSHSHEDDDDDDENEHPGFPNDCRLCAAYEPLIHGYEPPIR